MRYERIIEIIGELEDRTYTLLFFINAPKSEILKNLPDFLENLYYEKNRLAQKIEELENVVDSTEEIL